MDNHTEIQQITPLLQIVKFHKTFGGTLTEEYGIFKLVFKNDFGSGTIKCVSINNGISVLDIDVLLNDTFNFRLGDNDSQLLCFLYALEGEVLFKSDHNDKYQKIEALKSGVLSCDKESTNKLVIKKDVPLSLNIISIDSSLYFDRFKDDTNDTIKLQKLISSADNFKNYMYQCAFNLKIAEQLRIAKETGISHSILDLMRFDSQHLSILAMHIEQFFKEIHEERPTATLNKTELQKIIQLTEFIVESPEIQHSISSLCGKIYMSPAKLQEGFKEMHDTTVADFIRNVRIEKAEKLLNETDLNISEIVYTIGLTSRSYFCKIFKKKYDCSPKRYRKMIRNKITA